MVEVIYVNFLWWVHKHTQLLDTVGSVVWVSGLYCRTVDDGKPWYEAGDVLRSRCTMENGLLCVNSDNIAATGRPCRDYEVEVFCPEVAVTPHTASPYTVAPISPFDGCKAVLCSGHGQCQQDAAGLGRCMCDRGWIGGQCSTVPLQLTLSNVTECGGPHASYHFWHAYVGVRGM